MPRATNPGKNPENELLPSVDPAVKADVLSTIAESASKMTAVDLQRRLSDAFHYPNRLVRAAVRELIAEGELNFITDAGRTLVERSFNRPVRISRRIVLVPAGVGGVEKADTVNVHLQHGAAFGDGRHPTTRLALQGIEAAVDAMPSDRDLSANSVLDIGTGSGVLVIAAIRLGFGEGVGVDIDPCAVSEANANVALNQLRDRIDISHRSIETFEHPFDLICANLRWPTLKSLRNPIKDRLKTDGVLVLSGINTAEVETLIDWYQKGGLQYKWHTSQDDWAAVVLQISN